MWISTKYGFFSVVAAHEQVDAPHAGSERREFRYTPHPTLVMIRARSKVHLQKLASVVPELRPGSIQTTEDTDYPHRIITSRATLGRVMVAILADLDYTNFKSAVEHKQPRDHKYVHFLHDVWSLGLGMSDRPDDRAYIYDHSDDSEDQL
jgi:hypothetical protein